MKITKLFEKDTKLVFEIEGINEAEANTIRRILISEIPVMAIHEVEFTKNDSALYDEIIAHRLGLIPIKTDLNSYELKENPEETPKKAIEKFETTLSLSAKGPKTVYAEELIPKDPNIIPVLPKTPIVKLIDDQELQLTATVQLGLAKNHAKYQAGVAHYTYKPVLTLSTDSTKISKCKDQYPEKAIKDNKFDEEAIMLHNLYDACDGIDDNLFKVTYDDSKFIFKIESFGQLTPKEMLEKAIEVSDSKLDSFSKALKSAKPTPMKKLTDLVKKK